MTHSISHVRAVVVAVAVLALSAGAALAARSALTMPAASDAGLERAAEAAGKIVPVAGPPAEAAPVVQAPENVDEQKPAEEPAVGQAAEHPDNHGKTVSEAAHATTPDDFDNHGQYVKSIATDNHGQDVAAAPAGAQAAKGKPGR